MIMIMIMIRCLYLTNWTQYKHL